MPVGSGGEANSVWVRRLFFPTAVPSTTPTHGHFVLSPVWRPAELNDLTEK